MGFDNSGLESYNDVASRLAEFRVKHPEGSLQPANLDAPFTVQEIGGQTFIVYVAAAYRSPDDTRPGIGCAYEFFPGRTPYTKGSELQNAETAAWGRAIVAALGADTRKGVASSLEIRNRQAERDQPTEEYTDAVTDPEWLAQIETDFTTASTPLELQMVFDKVGLAIQQDRVSYAHREHLAHLYRQRQGEMSGQEAA
jgi:hypothetical protein